MFQAIEHHLLSDESPGLLQVREQVARSRDWLAEHAACQFAGRLQARQHQQARFLSGGKIPREYRLQGPLPRALLERESKRFIDAHAIGNIIGGGSPGPLPAMFLEGGGEAG